jgi:hypothetical protein
VADLLAYLLPLEQRHDDRARAGLVLVAEAIGDLRTTAAYVTALAKAR